MKAIDFVTLFFDVVLMVTDTRQVPIAVPSTCFFTTLQTLADDFAIENFATPPFGTVSFIFFKIVAWLTAITNFTGADSADNVASCVIFGATAAATTGTVVTGTVTNGIVVAGTVVAGTVAAGTVVAGTVVAGTVVAGTVVAGTVVAGTVVTGTVVTGTIGAGAPIRMTRPRIIPFSTTKPPTKNC